MSKKGGKGKGKGKAGDDDQEMIDRVSRLDCELKSLQERFSKKRLKFKDFSVKAGIDPRIQRC